MRSLASRGGGCGHWLGGSELLQLAGTSYETVKTTGCTLAITFNWDCFVDGASDGEPVRLIGVVCSESTLQS